ncbi:MAG: hypothetical protein LH632_19825 [Rhodoferax sp.]|nr:hypothetical protein [Rhodoferax sp.]
MQLPVESALAGALGRGAAAPALPRLLVAGATGAIGNAVLRRLVGMQRSRHTQVLANQPIAQGIRTVSAHVVPAPHIGTDDFGDWPLVAADMAVVMFDPPRLFYQRERALWTPAPAQLPALAAWLRRCGVHTLAVVLPHTQGRLPQALQKGLASLDEQMLSAVGFSRLLIVRSAQKPGSATGSLPHKTAAWMLGTLHYMLPGSEQPVRASRVAELVDLALQTLPPGTHVAPGELVWRAAQGDTAHMRRVLEQWLGERPV